MTLKDYISKATHYLYPDCAFGGAERQRQEFLTYCEQYGLDKKFQDLVGKDPKWKELAEVQQVYFFEDYIMKNPLGKEIKPELRLICTQLGTVPVIKLIREKY